MDLGLEDRRKEESTGQGGAVARGQGGAAARGQGGARRGAGSLGSVHSQTKMHPCAF
jgi:hypothetical protein